MVKKLIHISEGNTKIGETPNISLPPIISCRPDAPCFDRCYAVKFYKGYPEARKAWDTNWKLLQADCMKYFGKVVNYLSKNRPSFFRWHVSGDCPTEEYMHHVLKVSSYFPDIQFLMYTKQFEMVRNFSNITNNMTIILSMWPYLTNPVDLKFKRIWITGDLRCPNDARMCPDNCQTCRICWTGKHNVKIKLH